MAYNASIAYACCPSIDALHLIKTLKLPCTCIIPYKSILSNSSPRVSPLIRSLCLHPADCDTSLPPCPPSDHGNPSVMVLMVRRSIYQPSLVGYSRNDSYFILGAHLTWAVPVEPSSIAFAPNVTPITFNDPPSGAQTSFEPILFPSSGSDPSARRPTHSKKHAEDHIPRPPNAFILFRSSFIKNQHVSTGVETNHSTLSKIIGLTWQNMPHDERQVWHAKAKKALEEHRKRWPQYAFRPSHSKAKGGTEKRKVREVEPKDMKRCAKIAELLVEGKKGAELDAAIQEFDRTHVPEIVTRFETPITAGSYRRSSSAPIYDSQSKTAGYSSPRHVRAASSQPSSRPAEEPKALKPLAASHSCPDLSGTHSFGPSSPYTFPSRAQPSFVSVFDLI